MTIAVAGVSGNTGKVVAERLLAQGKPVRVIVRDASKGAEWKARGAEVAIADLSDVAALSSALQGVTGAYLLVPPNMTVPTFREYQDGVSRALAIAVEKARVPHVVLLSSVGAQHASGTGPIAGLHLTERLLGQVPGTVLSAIRAGYFYENLAPSLPVARDAGLLPAFFPEGLSFPFVSTRDIGELAAALLVDPPSKSQILELGTQRTHREIAEALTKILNKTVRVQEAPLEAVVPALTGAGLTLDMAMLYHEMTGALLRGHVAFEGGHRRVEASAPQQALAPLLAS